ncbi:S9 family peptidase [Exilibacterium tricleocarpae]|uniref:S9 family peptidase n=1 Tax=Exilibacterium tricleocarpae TaxID=2591008 RepID=A0A545U570_9GAMM|nr:S9 family peptidase [Exilibacterium tricleocarpae]TQV84612.1 S9 family peptidase [Exilibacterium tricleocarpae]
MSKITAPYGSWPSAVTTELLTAKSVRLSEPQLDGTDLYWIESRPLEKGRNAIVHRDAGGITRDVLPHPLNARSRVHEYGGGSFCVDRGVLYFVLFDDQRIYRLDTRQSTPLPQPLTPLGAYRHADLCLDRQRRRLICVREDHSVDKAEPRNTLVAVPLDGEPAVQVLVQGDDFYANPRLSPAGDQLSWLCWNHPDMPWDSSECRLASLDTTGRPGPARTIAGGDGESVFQPQWSPQGHLYLVSDRSNWWNLYRYIPAAGPVRLEPVAPLAAEFATPQWSFGMSTYGFLGQGRVLCCYTAAGRWQLATLDPVAGELTRMAEELSDISALCCNPEAADDQPQALFLGASATCGESLWQWQTDGGLQQIATAGDAALEPEDIAVPRAVTFASGTALAHGFYYPPTNARYQGPAPEKPPLLVFCHGGPTGATESSLNLKIQYWTSRGFAVLDVNYRGSTGYGRDYRRQLYGNWGITDVEDVCAGAAHLVEEGLADPDRLAIRGSSAGGYTVLAALAFADTFAAGASLYGIGDLETLARDTHKFEARYMDRLVGSYPAERALYRTRSPVHHGARLNCPVIFFQGLDDKVVPPNQAETMVDMLRRRGVPVSYITFAGEGHGFRQAASIKRALESELSFYSQLFGFTPADAIEAVTVVGLAAD